MKWIILLGLLLIACGSEEVIPEPEPSLEICGGLDYPCFRVQEHSDEYNQCNVDADCDFAPLASCECSAPNNPGKAVNKNKLEAYS